MHRFNPAPNLLLVGGPKTGTTSLMHWLSSHKQIFHPWSNESQFLMAGIAEFPTSPLHPRGTAILAPNTDLSDFNDENWIMDKSAFHIYSEQALITIRDQMPDAKIIITIRDPIEMMLSMHQEHRKRLVDYTTTQDEMIEKCKNVNFLPNLDDAETYNFLRFPRLKERVQTWAEELGDRVKIIQLSSIKERPLETVNEIITWLGEEEFSEDTKLSRQNESGEMNKASWAKIFRKPPQWTISLAKILIPSHNLRKTIFDPLRAPAFKPKPYKRPEISAETRDLLEKAFNEEIEFQQNITKYISSELLI